MVLILDTLPREGKERVFKNSKITLICSYQPNLLSLGVDGVSRVPYCYCSYLSLVVKYLVDHVTSDVYFYPMNKDLKGVMMFSSFIAHNLC